MWDKDGYYIKTDKDKLAEQSKKDSKDFVRNIDSFLKKHSISGIPYTYGFSTTKPEIAIEKLKKLGVKFKIDKSPNYHTKIIITKKDFKNIIEMKNGGNINTNNYSIGGL